VRHAPLSPVRLTDRHVRGINPALIELGRTRSPRYDALTADLAARSRAGSGGVCDPAPGGSAAVRQFENRASALGTAACDGLCAAWMALGGEDSVVISTPRAYPDWLGAGAWDSSTMSCHQLPS